MRAVVFHLPGNRRRPNRCGRLVHYRDDQGRVFCKLVDAFGLHATRPFGERCPAAGLVHAIAVPAYRPEADVLTCVRGGVALAGFVAAYWRGFECVIFVTKNVSL